MGRYLGPKERLSRRVGIDLDPAVAYRDEPPTERTDVDMSWIFADLPGTPAV